MIVLQWMAILIEWPWLAFAVAAFLGALFAALRTRLSAGAALLWAAYGIYEYLQYFRITCTGECNIRLDLLIAYPLLIAATVAALAGAAWRQWGRAR